MEVVNLVNDTDSDDEIIVYTNDSKILSVTCTIRKHIDLTLDDEDGDTKSSDAAKVEDDDTKSEDATNVEDNRAAVVTLHNENSAIATQDNTLMEILSSTLPMGFIAAQPLLPGLPKGEVEPDNIDSVGNQIEEMTLSHETDILDYDELIRMYQDTKETDPFWTFTFGI
jgi:hypothetical protein